jgi:hypothetical protein
MHSSVSLRPPESVHTATPPESAPTPTPSRRLSPPVRGDTLPVNLSHSRMPTKADGLEVPVNNGLIHSSPEQMLAPLSAASLSSRSMTSVNISGAPPGSSTVRSLSVPPPESSTSSTPKSMWQPLAVRHQGYRRGCHLRMYLLRATHLLPAFEYRSSSEFLCLLL